MKKYTKTDYFKACAMPCTEEQFNKLKPILEGVRIKVILNFFSDNDLLVNNYCNEKLIISNVGQQSICAHTRKLLKKFSKKKFLKNCGIVEISSEIVKDQTPNIEEYYLRIPISEINRITNDAELGGFVRMIKNAKN